MSSREIGARLVSLCQQGKNLESIQSLYAPDIETVEASTPPNGERIVRGKDAVLTKNRQFLAHHDLHKIDVAGPYPNGDDRFAVRFCYDATNTQTGERMNMEEIGLFTVKDDKIIREEYFYQFN